MFATKRTFGSPGMRLLQLYMLLGASNRRYSLGQLAGIFRCSRQSILRMMEQLERVPGMPIRSWIENKTRYYQIKPGRKSPDIALSIESLQHLVLCRDIVRNLLPKPIQEEIKRTIGAASVLLGGSKDDPGLSGSFAEARGKGTIDYTPHQKTLETIQRAMRERRICRIKYAAQLGGPVKVFSMAPIRLVAFREALYVRGHLLDPRGRATHKKPATLAIHRIHGTELMTPWERPLPECDDDHFFGFAFHAPLSVRIKFSPEAATYVSERTWSAEQQIQTRKDGSIVLRLSTTSRPELLSWVMSFGKEAELLSPAFLRRELSNMLSDTLQRYK